MDINKVHDFIVSRQLERQQRLVELDKEEEAIKLRLHQIQKEREDLRVEQYIYDNFDESDLLTITTTTTVRMGRMPNGTRMSLEDQIRRIFERKGCGMGPKELLAELEKANYTWSTYNSGYKFVMSLDCLEKVGRGYLQYRR